MKYPYYTADVFTDQVFQGAQIAVFPTASELSDDLMALMARELNLSQTVFVMESVTSGTSASDQPPLFRLRVFTPTGEIDFAGHPMLAAARVLVETGRIDLATHSAALMFRQNTGDIAANLTQRDGKPLFVQFTLPANPVVDRYTPTEAELARLLGIEERDIDTHSYRTRLVSVNFPYLMVPLVSQQAVRKARFSLDAWSQSSAPAMAAQEIFIFSNRTDYQETDFHGRLVGPSIGASEDPPIGSVMPCFAGYLGSHEHMREGTYTFTIDRGTDKTRRSVLHIEMDHHSDKPSTLRVGGEVVLVGECTLNIESY